MKKRRILIAGILMLLVTSIVILYQGKTVMIFIGAIGDTDTKGVEVLVKINNVTVWKDNIHSGLNNYTKLPSNLKFGYNTIEVISNNRNLFVKKEVFISINQHIVIEYIPPLTHPIGREGLSVEIRSGKFYYE